MPFGIKYRLYYGLAGGTCIVRYDNEIGSGHHRHFMDKEAPYQCKNVETLVVDFLAGIASARRLENELGRDYKNVHTDVRKLENAGLISRTEDNRIKVPWDIVEARLQPAA